MIVLAVRSHTDEGLGGEDLHRVAAVADADTVVVETEPHLGEAAAWADVFAWVRAQQSIPDAVVAIDELGAIERPGLLDEVRLRVADGAGLVDGDGWYAVAGDVVTRLPDLGRATAWRSDLRSAVAELGCRADDVGSVDAAPSAPTHRRDPADVATTWMEELASRIDAVRPAEALDHLVGAEVAPSLVAQSMIRSGCARPAYSIVDEIHSELTPRERRFLIGWMARRWDGAGDVLELGPFLGSSTRALGLGMVANPRRQPGARLVTYDRFSGYYRNEHQLSLLADVLPSHLLDEMATTGSFRSSFDHLHAGMPYAPLVDARVASLPDGPEDLTTPDGITASGHPLLRLEPDRRWSVVFIDAAKSWFGTRALMSDLGGKVDVGDTLIFQDYGHYTCFWVPAAVGAMRHTLRLVAHVDDTYTFEVVAPWTAAEAERAIPEDPATWGTEGIEAVFAERGVAAFTAGDPYGVLSAEMQRAAAHAYIGDLDRARAVLDALASMPSYAAFRQKIAVARRSPTYRPTGQVLL